MEKQLLAFLDHLQQEYKYSENTQAAYKNDLSQFLKFLSRNYPKISDWHEVTSDVIHEYVDFMNQKTYASSSIARKVAAVKSFFNYLHSKKIIYTNPTAEIDSPKVKKRLPKTLSFEDVERLLQAPTQKNTPKNLRDTALLTTLYATGMRVTEVVSLRQEDIDLENSVLHCLGKDDQERELPFDEATKKILATYMNDGRPYLVKNEEEQALFLNHRGQQLTRQGLWLIIKAYARDTKLSSAVTPHTLRHSFAAHKLESGTKLQDVQKLLGHANISTTQIYSQLSSDDEETPTEPVSNARPKIQPVADQVYA